MVDAGGLLKSARRDARLSTRSLAAMAGVAYSTVARIEAGQVDPTVGMLTKLLDATGNDLRIEAHAAGVPQLAELVDAWGRDANGQDRPDWTRLRGFLDYLKLHPQHRAVAVATRPTAAGSAFMDALLAGIAEQVSDEAAIPRPRWTRQIPPLLEPWISPGTPRMQARDRASTPPPLAARNLFLSADSLWRDYATIGA